MIANVTIDGEDYGTINLKPYFKGATLYDPEGAHYFCPDCGEIWASIRPAGYASHRVYNTRCRRHHRSFFDPGGSLWLPLHDEVNNAFNERILVREFLLHLDLAAQYQVDIESPVSLHPCESH